MGQIYLKNKYQCNRNPLLEPQDVRNFFNKEIKTGELKAFIVLEQENVIKRKEENKVIIITERKVILNQVDNIDEQREYLIKFCKEQTYYLLVIKNRLGFYGSKEIGIRYKYKLKKLIPEFDVKELRKRRGFESPDEIIAPRESILAEIIVDYHKDFGEFIIFDSSPWRVYLKRRGKDYEIFEDELFKKLFDFVEERISIAT